MTQQDTTEAFTAAFDRATQAAELAARIDHIHRTIDTAIQQKTDTLEDSLAALFAVHEDALRTIEALQDEQAKARAFRGLMDGVPG